jgi:hypothetical protein
MAENWRKWTRKRPQKMYVEKSRRGSRRRNNEIETAMLFSLSSLLYCFGKHHSLNISLDLKMINNSKSNPRM